MVHGKFELKIGCRKNAGMTGLKSTRVVMDVRKRKGREMDERKPHKWSEVIKAWADGKPIQVMDDQFYCEWTDYPKYGLSPDFNSDHLKWRIKPKNIVREGEVSLNPYLSNWPGNNNNIRLEFDPDTKKLVKAEVIG